MQYLNLATIENQYYWKLYKQFRSVGWSPEDYPLDSFNNLFSQDKNFIESFIKIFSYLIFLDSSQVRILPEFSIINQFGSPELLCLLGEHQAQEIVHCHSYQYITSPLDEKMRRRIYEEMYTDKFLQRRSEQILTPYRAFMEDKTNLKKLGLAYFADYLLEGFLFFNGFVAMCYNEKIFPNISTIIKLIWRDEQLHVLIFQSLVKELLKKGIITNDECLELALEIIANEIDWLTEVLGDFLPLRDAINHSVWLMNKRLSDLGVEQKNPSLNNPFKDIYARIRPSAKINPMEGKVVNYSAFTGLKFGDGSFATTKSN